MKKLLLLLMAFMIILLLVSCKGGDTTNTTPNSSSIETTRSDTTQSDNTQTDPPAEHVHTEETMLGVDATCLQTGLTEGKKCATCGEVLVEQSDISKTGHTESDWIVDREPTKTEDGCSYIKCTVCKTVIREKVLYATGSVGLSFTQRDDGTYAVSGIGTCTDVDVVIPAYYNDVKVTTVNSNAFWNCESIKSIVIPETVTCINLMAFQNCTSLESVTIPNSVTQIWDSAFWGCTSLKSMIIPDSVKVLGESAFRNCSSLESVEIGCSVTSIGANAFRDCSTLSSIVYRGTKEQWSALDFGTRWNEGISATVVTCTDGDIEP